MVAGIPHKETKKHWVAATHWGDAILMFTLAIFFYACIICPLSMYLFLHKLFLKMISISVACISQEIDEVCVKPSQSNNFH